MLNSTKTWQEDYHKQELIRKYTDILLDNKDMLDVVFINNCLSRLITDLRKQDEDELINKLETIIKEPVEPVNNKEEENQWYYDTHFNCGVYYSKKLIKDYYENN